MMMPMIVMLFRFITKQACYAVNYQAHDNPHSIKHCRGHQHIKNRRPQFFQWRIIVENRIDVQAHGYNEAHEQRQQFGADAAGRDVYVRH